MEMLPISTQIRKVDLLKVHSLMYLEETQRPYMYDRPYASTYALPDMRCITLVLRHNLIQSPSSDTSIFSYKTSDDAETYMQHVPISKSG